MKINKIKINAFGRLEDKEIELFPHINIIYGKNESGKSTLLKFITCMLYGISKNKRGKEISDYEKYDPWKAQDFSGKLEYELDNEKKYEVFRDFRKRSPNIYNEKAQDITKEFKIDKTEGNQFFQEQTKIEENLFFSTLAIMQQEVKLDKNTQNGLIEKIANLLETGEDSISLKKAFEKLNKKQIEEIGTPRSQERPINIIENRLQEIKIKKRELETYKNKKYEIEEIKIKLEEEIKKQEQELNSMKKIKTIKEEEQYEKEKINTKVKMQEEIEIKIKELKLKKEIEKNKIIKNNNQEINKNKILYLFLTVFIIINIINFIFIKDKIINYIILSFIPVCAGIYEIIRFQKNKKIKEQNKKEELENKKTEQEINIINTQIEILENNQKIEKEEIEKLNQNLDLKIKLEKQKINPEEKVEINYLFKENNLNTKIEILQNKCNENKLKLHQLELDKNNLFPQLDTLVELEEEKIMLEEQYAELQEYNGHINLAKEILQIAYDKMKNTITPKFTQTISQTMQKISNGKYKTIKLNQENTLMVELENGDYICVDKLSIGTIDQVYLSLRLAVLKEIAKENMPIILDEVFAYYDKERLKNSLQYLAQESNNQILVFTCTKREIEIAKENNIPYHVIEL